MKLKLIHPCVGKKGKKYVRTWQMEPLNLAVLASLTPNNVEISFSDDRVEDIDFDDPSDLIGITVETYNAKRAYYLADNFRNRGIPVVLGGVHPTLIPEEAKEHADSILIGDAENVWSSLIRDFKKGKLKSTYDGSDFTRALKHVKPNRSIFQGKDYLPLGLVETGRGCRFSCDFCSISGMFRGIYRTKSIEDIVHDIQDTGKKYIYFVDDNFVSDKKRTKDLCEAITPLNIRWISQGSINMVDDLDLLSYLEKSGCINMLIGFESLNSSNLKSMGKNWAVLNRDYGEAIKNLRDHGITLYGTFVFGYDEDTPDDFKRTLDFAIENKLAYAAFNHLVPFPGTPIYERLKSEERLLDDKWWLSDGYKFGDVAFLPKNMSPEELSEGCYSCRKDFYRYGSILSRGLDFKANSKNLINSIIFFYSNIISRKGIQQRQGWPVGEVLES